MKALGVHDPNPKLQSLLAQEQVKLYGLQIRPIHSQGPCEQKSIKNLGEKGAWAYPGTAQIFWVPILLCQKWVKLQTSNFVRIFIG